MTRSDGTPPGQIADLAELLSEFLWPKKFWTIVFKYAFLLFFAVMIPIALYRLFL